MIGIFRSYFWTHNDALSKEIMENLADQYKFWTEIIEAAIVWYLILLCKKLYLDDINSE